MRFLADQDVYAITVGILRGLGHDLATAAELGMARAEDAELLRIAHEQRRIFVTRDRDFGGLVFLRGSGPGVIYLRILPSTLYAVHAELERVLNSYSEQELLTSFVVVEPGRHRIRKGIAYGNWSLVHSRRIWSKQAPGTLGAGLLPTPLVREAVDAFGVRRFIAAF